MYIYPAPCDMQAQSLNINPLYFMFPTSLASSLAFILPIASTSNAVAFASGHITTSDMAKAGSVVNIIGVLVLLGSVFTYGTAYILNPALEWGAKRNGSVLTNARNVFNITAGLEVYNTSHVNATY